MQLGFYLGVFSCFNRELGLDASSIAALITSFLTIAGVVVGAKWQYGKSKAAQLSKLLSLILKAAEDDAVSEEEFQGIVALAKSLMGQEVAAGA
jgi:hypothetical protein